MLSNVLDDYLDSVGERDFDIPFLSLLPALGFYDIHLTHGSVEFGKNFIAKRLDESGCVQYAFRSKARGITQTTWRNEIMGQILEAMWNGLSHPNFDKHLPRQVVLVCAGEFRGNAAISLDQFNETLEAQHHRPVEFWGKRYLGSLLLRHGLEGVHQASAAGFREYGQFFSLYSQAFQGMLTIREIENYSRRWVDADLEPHKRLLWATVEAELLAQQCEKHNLVFEAVQCHLACMRVLSEQVYSQPTLTSVDLWSLQVERVHEMCSNYVTAIRRAWDAERDLVKTWFGELDVVTYPVQCLRIMELAALAYFSAPDQASKAPFGTFLRDFISVERGCARPVSDRHAVSVVLAALALIDQGHRSEVASLLEQATVWVCDWYEHRIGLGGIEAAEEEESLYLLGYPFDLDEIVERHDSFLPTAIMDLAAFLGDIGLYSDIVNDVKAVRIFPSYWQAQDTAGACRIEGRDVLTYPAVSYADHLTPFADLMFAEHIAAEPPTFQFFEAFGRFSAPALMALLRDRYFPRLWAHLASIERLAPPA